MENSERDQEARLFILKGLFRPYIEGRATLDEVLLEQAKCIGSVEKRLERVETLVTLSLETLAAGKEIRNRGD